MARVIVVDDAYSEVGSLLLAGAGNRNLPARAVNPNAVAATWAATLAAGRRSGTINPVISFGIVDRGMTWDADPLGVDTCAFIGMNAVNEFEIASYTTGAPPVAYPLRLSGAGGIAFFAGTPAVMPSVTGSRSDGTGPIPALDDLLSVLASMGLITDNTTP